MKDTKGFTLIEIMVAMAIFAIVVTGIYQTYHFQQRSYMKQEKVVDMQQNLRAGLYFLKRDIRMAGYDPTEDADATITIANIAELKFEFDENGDGDMDNNTNLTDSGEIIRLALTDDDNKNGIADWIDSGSNPRSNPCRLGREYITLVGVTEKKGGLQPVSENVDALEFCYILADGTETTSPSDPDDIRSIIVSMLARTENPIKGHTDDKTYTQASNDTNLTPNLSTRPPVWGPFNDSYQRRLLVTKLRCRNMGMNPYAD